MTKFTKHLFIAIRIPNDIRQELSSVCNFFQHPYLRWTPLQNLHITLHFIGQTELSEIPVIKEKISLIAPEVSSFSMTVGKLKVIKKNRHPVMIWATLEECDTFNELALRLKKDLPGDNSKKPNPHITLARIKRGKKLQIPDLPDLVNASFEIRSIELMESKPGESAPVYEVVESFRLRK